MILYWEKSEDRIISVVNYIVEHAKTISDRWKKIDGEWKEGRKYLLIGSGFDIETSRIETKSWVSSFCYHWQFSLDDWIFGGRSLDSYTEFLDCLLSAIKKRGAYLLCLDANLGYEFQFCKRRWNIFGMSNLFAKEKRNPLKLDIGNAIEMREILGLFGGSLEQVAKNYTKTQKLKGDLDFSKVRLSTTPLSLKERQYCENDVKILSELGHYIFDNFFGKNSSLPMTKTGIIRAKVRKRLGANLKSERERIQRNLPDEETYNIHRNFLFKGGICGTNVMYTGRTLKDVVCADYTSDYPACMNHYKFPDGKLTELENPDEDFMSEGNVPYIGVVEFYGLDSRTQHSFLSSSKALDFNPHDPNLDERYVIDNGRIQYADKITFIVNDVEYRALAKAYTWESTKVIKAWRIEKYIWLPDHLMGVLNSEYLNKQELKAQGLDETLEYKDSKAVVNGTYGMTVTAIFTEELGFEGCEIEPPKDENGNVIKKPYSEAIKSVFLNPYWGFWITSYARSLLMEIITTFPDPIVQYDTDSIYYLKNHKDTPELEKFIADYNEMIYRINNVKFDYDKRFRDLGAWDVSKPFKRFRGLGAKRYMYEKYDGTIKTVVAGCRKGTIQKQLEYNNEVNNENMDIFEFFNDRLIVDKKHAKKLASKYVDKYDGEYSAIVSYKDYLGNEEKIYLESAVVLEPIEFKMTMAPRYITLFKAMQGIYKNAPMGSPICHVYERIVYGKD